MRVSADFRSLDPTSEDRIQNVPKPSFRLVGAGPVDPKFKDNW